jgi:Tfp pilus assembly protein FimT
LACAASLKFPEGDIMPSNKTALQRGYSITEALIVLALIGCILVVAIPALYRMIQNYRTSTTAAQMAVYIRFARNAAVKQKVVYRVRVNRDSDAPSNRYFIEYDPSGTNTFVKVPHLESDSICNCVLMPVNTRILDSTTATSLVLTSTGQTAGSGEIFIEGADGTQYRIKVSAVGGVEKTKL